MAALSHTMVRTLALRRPALLFLCSLAPGGALVGCFGSSTPIPADAGIDERPDATFLSFDSSSPVEGAVPEARSDVEREAGPDGPDAEGPEATDAPAVDAPLDSSPVGIFPTAGLDFGLVDCGTAPDQTWTYSFTNTGPVALTYAATVGSSTLFSIEGAKSGTVAPGGTGSITLAAGMVPVTSTAGAAIAGTLTLTTDVPGFTSVDVPLQITPRGGSLTLSPATAAFNDVQLTVQAPDLPLTLANVGNAPVAITLGAPTDSEFAVVYTGAPGPATVAAGATLVGAAARFAPTSAGAKSATVALHTTGVLCASPATSIPLTGTGTTEPVTVGPGVLSFGLVDCGSQSAQVLPVTITNGYSVAVDYATALAAGSASPYSLDVPTGSVPASGQAVIHVTPLPVPATASVAPGFFDDTLTVTTTAPTGSPSTVSLEETAQGAILALAVPGTAFGEVVAGQIGRLPFTVTNTGNLNAPITLIPAGAGFGGAFTGSATASAGSGTAVGNATFTPATSGSVRGTLSIGTSAPRCAALPGAVALTGTGVGPVATYATEALVLAVTCGGAASSTASLLVTNSTAYPLTLMATSQSGLFNVLTPSLTIPASSSGSISIQAPAVAIGSKAAGAYLDDLRFTTNEFGNPTHSVAVNLTVNGANLSFSGASSFDFTSCPERTPFTVQNTGNAPVTVTEPADTLNVGFDQFANAPSVMLGAGQTATAEVRAITNDITAAGCSGGPQIFTFTASTPTGAVAPVCVNTLRMTVSWTIPTGDCPAGMCC
jgi:hypothetical protein